MGSFAQKNVELPLGAVWLLNTVAEYKGKQDLYCKQSPQILKTLVEIALVESAESSNRIEGIVIDRARLKPLLIEHSKPRDRSEEEVAGYRRALDLIHKKYQSLKITPDVVLELHRLCRYEAWDAGKWKEKDNEIIRTYPDGNVEVVFKPLSAKVTPKAMEQLCLAYEKSIAQDKYPPLYAVACLILDFLCIHPFRDGNGRVSRLLTLLALYQHGFIVGRYISLERIIEQTKESYYENLNRSSQKWVEGQHDVLPWLYYFLGTVSSAYREFAARAESLKPLRGAKTSVIESAIRAQVMSFTIADIEQACSNVSRPMIRVVLERLREEGAIKLVGIGRNAKWQKCDNNYKRDNKRDNKK